MGALRRQLFDWAIYATALTVGLPRAALGQGTCPTERMDAVTTEVIAQIIKERKLNARDVKAFRYLDDVPEDEHQTQMIVEMQTPAHETPLGKVHYYKRTGPRWASNHGDSSGNPDGSPEMMTLNLGTAASRVMGVDFIADDVVTLPDGDRLSQGVRQINTQLVVLGKEPMPIDFYDSVDKQTPVEYLTRVAKEGALPVAAKVRVHDGIHAASVLPKRIWDHVQLQSDCAVEFRKFVQNQNPPASKYALLDTEVIVNQRVSHIDREQAFYNLNDATRGDPAKTHEGFSSGLEDKKVSTSLFGRWTSARRMAFDGESPIQVLRFGSTKELRPLIDEFVKSLPADSPFRKAVNMPDSYQAFLDFNAEVEAKRKDIDTAARMLPAPARAPLPK